MYKITKKDFLLFIYNNYKKQYQKIVNAKIDAIQKYTVWKNQQRVNGKIKQLSGSDIKCLIYLSYIVGWIRYYYDWCNKK